MKRDVVFEDIFFIVTRPSSPLNCRDDGGHLIMHKKDAVMDRSDMTAAEAVDFMRISMAVGRAMYEVLEIERMNYEDLGNWGVDHPDGPKMHLHFLGRAHRQIHQQRGHHIALFPQGHPIYEGHLKPLTDEHVQQLRHRVAEILKESKYRQLAEWAGLATP